MELLITVTRPCADHLEPLLRACLRRQCDWQVFLTGDGMQVLQSQTLADLLVQNCERVVACHDSWRAFHDENECPLTVGSQTNHSDMVARAERVVGL